MKKYKVIEKTTIDSYGREKKLYYIKKNFFFFFWTYVIEYEEEFSSKLSVIFLGSILGLLANLILSFALIPLVSLIGIYHLFIVYPVIMVYTQHLMKCAEKDDFCSLNNAQNKLKTLIKKESFKNKNVEVLEVSVGRDKIIFEKK